MGNLIEFIKEYESWFHSIGGIGGISFLVSLWHKRVNVAIDVLTVTYRPISYQCDTEIIIELTNQSDSDTSVLKNVVIKTRSNLFGSTSGSLNIQETSRYLEPYRQVTLTAFGNLSPSVCFAKFGKIKFRFTRGRSKTIYYFENPKNVINSFNYYYLLISNFISIRI